MPKVSNKVITETARGCRILAVRDCDAALQTVSDRIFRTAGPGENSTDPDIADMRTAHHNVVLAIMALRRAERKQENL